MLALPLILGLVAQDPPPAPEKDADAPTRLAFMKGSVAPYKVHGLEADAPPLKLLAEPVFRLNNPLTSVKDGAIFLWLDDAGRPDAAVQVFRLPNGAWLHEFTSLSTAPLMAEVGSAASWRPARAGLEYKAIPEAPKPAGTAEARLRQIRALAQDFAAEDNFEGKGWNALRLLPKPLLRYGKPGGSVEDGALLPFVLGTDPEVFLMIEARAGRSGLEWQYALAPMTSYAVRATWKGRPAWSLPWRNDAPDPGEPFYDMEYIKER